MRYSTRYKIHLIYNDSDSWYSLKKQNHASNVELRSKYPVWMEEIFKGTFCYWSTLLHWNKHLVYHALETIFPVLQDLD